MDLIQTSVVEMKHSDDHMVEMEVRLPGPAWARHPMFPLIPQATYRTGNKQNTWSFRFSWLAFRLWTSDVPSLGVEVGFSQAQLQFRLTLPYLYTGLFIPVMPHSWEYKLWRRPVGREW